MEVVRSTFQKNNAEEHSRLYVLHCASIVNAICMAPSSRPGRLVYVREAVECAGASERTGSMVGPCQKLSYIFFVLRFALLIKHHGTLSRPHQRRAALCQLSPRFCYVDWLFRRLGDTILSTITSSICSLERAQRPAKVIPLVLQCLSESQDDFASKALGDILVM